MWVERGLKRGGRRRGRQSEFHTLTVEAGEVSPVQQGAVEGGQRGVEERVGAIGRVSDGVGEQVHLQQGLEQITQHLATQRDRHSTPPSCCRSHCLSLTVCPQKNVGVCHWVLLVSSLGVQNSYGVFLIQR